MIFSFSTAVYTSFGGSCRFFKESANVRRNVIQGSDLDIMRAHCLKSAGEVVRLICKLSFTNLFPYVSSHISLERRTRRGARTQTYSPERFQSSRVVRMPCDLVEMSYVVGVDVGGTKTRVGLGNSRGRMVS